ncbi:hypothetical protein TNCV_2552321 [Trichonephila clavipes]|nr:hypothetical protein TNCV_2552321 [Trichonephila clavipes]
MHIEAERSLEWMREHIAATRCPWKYKQHAADQLRNRDYTGMWVRLGSTDLMAGKVMLLRSNQGGRFDGNESVADSFRSDLVPPDSREYIALSCGRSESALRLIWTAVRGQHMIEYAWDSQNKSIFHRQSQYEGDMTCVFSEQATFRTRFFGFPVDGPLTRVVPIY